MQFKRSNPNIQSEQIQSEQEIFQSEQTEHFQSEQVNLSEVGKEPGIKQCKGGCGETLEMGCICHQCLKDGKTHYNLKLTCCKNASSMKPYDQWSDVCTPAEWQHNEAGCDSRAQQKALDELYSNFTAIELVSIGIRPPKWKEHYRTKQQAVESLREAIAPLEEKETVTDYSKWH